MFSATHSYLPCRNIETFLSSLLKKFAFLFNEPDLLLHFERFEANRQAEYILRLIQPFSYLLTNELWVSGFHLLYIAKLQCGQFQLLCYLIVSLITKRKGENCCKCISLVIVIFWPRWLGSQTVFCPFRRQLALLQQKQHRQPHFQLCIRKVHHLDPPLLAQSAAKRFH